MLSIRGSKDTAMQAFKHVLSVRKYARSSVTLAQIWEDALEKVKKPLVKGEQVRQEDYNLLNWLSKSADAYGVRWEIIKDQVRKYSSPTGAHQYCSIEIIKRYSGDDNWFILPGQDIQYQKFSNKLCHDISGWRVPVTADDVMASEIEAAMTIPPDWAVEISRSTMYRDLPRKYRPRKDAKKPPEPRKIEVCAEFGVGHYWIVDIEQSIIQVFKHNNPKKSGQYKLVQKAGRADGMITLEPFNIAIDLPRLFKWADK